MVDESQGRSGFQQIAALQFHAVARILGVFTHDHPQNFTEYEFCFQSAAGEYALAHVRGANPNQSEKFIKLRIEYGCGLWHDGAQIRLDYGSTKRWIGTLASRKTESIVSRVSPSTTPPRCQVLVGYLSAHPADTRVAYRAIALE